MEESALATVAALHELPEASGAAIVKFVQLKSPSRRSGLAENHCCFQGWVIPEDDRMT
jgi:hypothetical protein